jgi:hypothetical protein
VYKKGQTGKVNQIIMPHSMTNLEGTIMDEGYRGMEQMADLQQNTEPSAETFPTSDLSEYVREWGMTCPKCQRQNAAPFMSWTLSGRKMTIPQLRMWACLNPTCLHKWPRESELDEIA